MFILHTSNKTENLVAHLAAVLDNAPLASPFAQELFLIQSQGMERWLFQQLAMQLPVWANYRFLFPEHFFNHIAGQLGLATGTEAFDRKLLLWRIEQLLRHVDSEELAVLRTYLSGANPALKRFQLARSITQLFDQYQIMRPDLLAAWQQGRQLYDDAAEAWQKALWRRLTQDIGVRHRGSLWLETIDALNKAPVGELAVQVPERVCVFGVSTMPPLFLHYLQSLARHCQIHLFLLNPAQAYWADLAGKRHQPPTQAIDHHPLLASLGQQGREFQAMLLEFAQFDLTPESFVEEANPNNLQQLQNDILHNNLSGSSLDKDGSISIHACHSRKREVEVLKDQLLQALECDPTLQLRDIVVMAPDIQAYEPFIAAVFHDIQHAVADRSFSQENPCVDAFIRFLKLATSRLGWQGVLDLLEREAVYSAFGLAESDLDLIRYWVEDTRVRWGESGEHKAELGLPALEENTWRGALARLLMGYAVGEDNEFVLDVLPYKNIEGSSAQALGGLHDFLSLLFTARKTCRHPHSLEAWAALFNGFADVLFGAADPLVRQALNELFLDLAEAGSAGHQQPVELAVILEALANGMAEQRSAQGFLRGQLTFCSMLPMRSIPFKVIAVMGLNEGEFPKIERSPTFDLISRHFRVGDRSRRKDDRYQFLEILLSARQQLILTYIGQSQSSNESIPPSVVVSELLSVLNDFYQLAGIETRHPLQAFSPRYFDGESGLFSFSRPDCATAQALADSRPENKPWWTGSLPAPSGQIIALDDLFGFFHHPQRYFLRRHFALYPRTIDADTEEREPFALDSLDAYSLRQEWLGAILKGEIPPTTEKLRAQGRWPAGEAGGLLFRQYQLLMQGFVERIDSLNLGNKLPAVPIDVKIGEYRLIGQVDCCYDQGNLLCRCAKLKGSDFIRAWLCHLISNLLDARQTYLLSQDNTFNFISTESAAAELQPWLEIYQAGQEKPDAFFTEAAFAYMQQAYKLQQDARTKLSPLAKAQDAICKAFDSAYESEIRQLFANVTAPRELINAAHAAQWDTLLIPVWEGTNAG